MRVDVIDPKTKKVMNVLHLDEVFEHHFVGSIEDCDRRYEATIKALNTKGRCRVGAVLVIPHDPKNA